MKDLEKNVELYLKNNDYPGRVIVIGENDAGKATIVYAIMGRTESSQNRFFERTRTGIRTAPIDSSKIKDPELLIYNAIDEVLLSEEKRSLVVTNGRQTDALVKDLPFKSPEQILENWEYEPDAPNYTPRISGVIELSGAPAFSLSILKAEPEEEKMICARKFFNGLPVEKGMGFLISTYAKNGDPLPSFRGDPVPVPLAGNVTDIAEAYWQALNPEFRVALCVKTADPRTFASELEIINKRSA